ncbi:hypothetical protein [Catenulispora subtropica]|uniref:Peptidase inhibitor family I36 n=1 Tax=Catenulispora subtropica TaxID=450798 RepID=A0ABP5DPR6_9ACTN
MTKHRMRLAVAGVLTTAALTATLGLSGTANAATAGSSVNGSVRPMSSYAMGVDYVDAGYSGSSNTATTGDANFCRDGQSWYWNSMPGGWNDVVSSLRVYGNCWTTIYEDINEGGAQATFTSDSSYVGNAMNDRTSSQRWF